MVRLHDGRSFGLLMSLLAALFLLAGCGRAAAADAVPYVDLSARSPLPVAAPADVVPLRIAVAAILSPQGTAESYGALAAYLGGVLERPVELVQRRTYEEVNALVSASEVDVAFVCTSAYIDGQADFGMELLVAPQIEGKLSYNSVLIVPAGSDVQTMADLEGKVYAFTDPMSFSGRVYPTWLVQQMGTTPELFFERTFFTYSHDKAIQAVAEGVADGASVDSLVLDHALRRDLDLAGRVRIVDRSPDFGIPPIVVSPNLPPRQRLEILDALLGMDKSRDGLLILAELGIDRFVPVTDDLYDSARELTAKTEGTAWAQ